MDPEQPLIPQDDEQTPESARPDGSRIIARDAGPLYFRPPDWVFKRAGYADFTPEEKEQWAAFCAPLFAQIERLIALEPYRQAALARLPQWARERIELRQTITAEEMAGLTADFAARFPKLSTRTNPSDAIANFRWNAYKTLVHRHRELELPPRLDDAPDYDGPEEHAAAGR